jgi:hypothetical protein
VIFFLIHIQNSEGRYVYDITALFCTASVSLLNAKLHSNPYVNNMMHACIKGSSDPIGCILAVCFSDCRYSVVVVLLSHGPWQRNRSPMAHGLLDASLLPVRCPLSATDLLDMSFGSYSALFYILLICFFFLFPFLFLRAGFSQRVRGRLPSCR